MDKYYVISDSDGDTSVDELTKEEILKRMGPDHQYYGHVNCLSGVPKECTNAWGEKLLVIKGTVVSLKPIKEVIKYDID